MPPHPHIHPDAIADCVLSAFNALPAKFKPRRLPDGRREWVPLAGIVLSRAGSEDHGPPPSSSSSLTCAALATGMKCLPQDKVPLAKGNVLHDWHAEVLALRGFNRFLVDECADLAARGVGSIGQWVKWRREGEELRFEGHERNGEVDEGMDGEQPFALQEDVSIHMYCSEAPCGDASMELTMAEQEDATPWILPQHQGCKEDGMLGRAHFDQPGIVRRKPARPDAPPTLSKSCSDKLALKQCTGLLSGLVSRLVWPGDVYLGSLVLPEGRCVRGAVDRAFGVEGRMGRVVDGVGEEGLRGWRRAGYRFRPFEVVTTSREFEYSKGSTSAVGSPSTPMPASAGAAAAVPSNLSALSIDSTPKRQEILINGVLQGRKQFDPMGASCVSRRRLWKAVLDVALLTEMPDLVEGLRKGTYGEVKADTADAGLREREVVKKDVREVVLKGWKRNVGDEDWGLEDANA